MCVLIVGLSGCEPAVRERPYGDLRVGKMKDLLGPRTLVRDAGLLIRRDEGGWSAMSTLCTHDLSVLQLKDNGQGPILTSMYTASTYGLDGTVLTGPAVKPLQYYELFIDQGLANGPRDTLYAKIGVEKDRNWRLPVPPEFVADEQTSTDAP